MSISNYDTETLLKALKSFKSLEMKDNKLHFVLESYGDTQSFCIDEVLPGTFMHKLLQLIELHLTKEEVK